ncbi:MAG: DUF167 domain-containing protein [Candidatus Adiutrix sp.]|nr:DUF167 domain-containing protein [Candidatus Adiutrix sp.]
MFCHLKVLLSPRARANSLVGRQGEELKIKIAAPPVEGAANEALVKFLAGLLNHSRLHFNIVAGQRGRRKLLRIEDLTEQELRDRLEQLLNGLKEVRS